MKKAYSLIIALGLFLICYQTKAQEKWTVSDAEKALTNPLKINDATLENGMDLFTAKCQSCHGPVGENKPLALTPTPPDLGNLDYLKTHSAGEIFTKLTNGRVAMPSFKSQLSETERWEIVAYLQDIAGITPNTKATSNTESTKEFIGSALDLELEIGKNNSTVNASLQGKDNKGNITAAAGVKLQYFIKRYFGNLPIGEAVTNEKGFASVEIPPGIPLSYEDGTMDLIVNVKNKKKFGEVSQTIKLDCGTECAHVNLLEKRSLWTTRNMAPLWLIISFHSVVAGVWIFIFYVLVLVVRMRKAGTKNETTSV